MLTANDNSRARAQYAALVQHYRAIGPAAILAALICMPKQRTKHSLPTRKAA